MKTNQVREEASAANDAVFEIEVLRDIINVLREDHPGCDHAETQIAVLDSIIDEKLHFVFHATELITESLTRPIKKSKKKGGVVKMPAAA